MGTMSWAVYDCMDLSGIGRSHHSEQNNGNLGLGDPADHYIVVGGGGSGSSTDNIDDNDRAHVNGHGNGNMHSYRHATHGDPRGNDDRHGRSLQPTSGYLPYLYPSVNYPQGYIQSNGHFVINLTQPHHAFMMMDPPPLPTPILPLPGLVENPKANAIMNDVNLKKTTLRLDEDEENPGFYLVAFSFDATLDGWICIFFHAKEGQECSLTAIKPELHEPIRIPFKKGMGQHFKQAPGTGVNLSLFAESDLVDEGPEEVHPLVVRTETIPKDPPPTSHNRDEEPIDTPLPKWVHAQMTHAVLEKKEDGYMVKVVKQIIYVGGVRYELQEIYGIENADGSVGIDGNDAGKECVICLSELRDTTVLPCRHMCMCSGCAKVLRFQSNRCPICRTPVDRLLEIKVSKKEGNQGIGKAEA